MSKSLIVIITLLLIALLSFGKYVSVRNTLVSKNEAVKSAWSQVDVVLQRRADLIPNLVETVKELLSRSRLCSAKSRRRGRRCFQQARPQTRLPPTSISMAPWDVCWQLPRIIRH